MIAETEIYQVLENYLEIPLLSDVDKNKISKKLSRYFERIPVNSARIVAIKGVPFVLCNENDEMKIFELN